MIECHSRDKGFVSVVSRLPQMPCHIAVGSSWPTHSCCQLDRSHLIGVQLTPEDVVSAMQLLAIAQSGLGLKLPNSAECRCGLIPEPFPALRIRTKDTYVHL